MTELFVRNERPNIEKPGLTPRGKRMPDSMEEWRYLAGLYADEIIHKKEEISILKTRINKLEQKVSKLAQRNK
ncbi:MAG: hypothetical protein GY820_21245 [Gammaproteobacteria bacterium]|nr:hypothetical protein [Gammaproteobacteria bacterium]